jgi:hypothetical protein
MNIPAISCHLPADQLLLLQNGKNAYLDFENKI